VVDGMRATHGLTANMEIEETKTGVVDKQPQEEIATTGGTLPPGEEMLPLSTISHHTIDEGS
jgi:hypothetical protein